MCVTEYDAGMCCGLHVMRLAQQHFLKQLVDWRQVKNSSFGGQEYRKMYTQVL